MGRLPAMLTRRLSSLVVLAFVGLAGVGAGCANGGGADAAVDDAGIPADASGVGDAGGAGTDVAVVETYAPPPPVDATGVDVAPAPGCTRQCDGRACGPDGCGGLCGTCLPGETCTPEGACEPLAGKAAFGSWCGVTTSCHPAAAEGGDEPWPACLDAQCVTGVCRAPACSMWCDIAADDVDNATGEPQPDGVEDPDFDTCAGATDAVYAGPWRCVRISDPAAPPIALCLPGTAFAPCAADEDCPAGETCELVTIAGVEAPRCIARLRAAAAVGAPCQTPPAANDAPLCAAPSLCGPLGCSALCASDDACSTASAQCTPEGTCAAAPWMACASDADCSAWVCRDPLAAGVPPARVDLVEGVCAPRGCSRDADCLDPDFRCRPALAPPDQGKVAWAPQCVHVPAQANATLGEPCANDPAAGVVCDNPDLCFKGQCGALCAADDDCAAAQRCAVAELPFDLDGDGAMDAALPLRTCEPLWLDGPPVECARQQDCPEGTTCAPIELPAPLGVAVEYTLHLWCRAMPDYLGGYGAACGTTPGSGECRLGFCPSYQGGPGTCSQVCASADDCPALDGTPFACAAVPYGWNGTTRQRDDLFVPVCVPVEPGSSLIPCGPTTPCPDANEACVPFVLATVPYAPVSIDYRCVRRPPGAPDPPGGTGAPCTTDADCASLMCLPDVGSGGYCTALCASDVDCLDAGPFAVCDDYRPVERLAASLEATVPRCTKARTCIPCARHADCAEGMRCVRVGDTYACAWSCTADADCAATDGGDACLESQGVEGDADRPLTCHPGACP